MEPAKCQRCGQSVENGVVYQCCRCFTKYCSRCLGSQAGRLCPQCGMGARLILPLDPPHFPEVKHGT